MQAPVSGLLLILSTLSMILILTAAAAPVNEIYRSLAEDQLQRC